MPAPAFPAQIGDVRCARTRLLGVHVDVRPRRVVSPDGQHKVERSWCAPIWVKLGYRYHHSRHDGSAQQTPTRPTVWCCGSGQVESTVPAPSLMAHRPGRSGSSRAQWLICGTPHDEGGRRPAAGNGAVHADQRSFHGVDIEIVVVVVADDTASTTGRAANCTGGGCRALGADDVGRRPIAHTGSVSTR